MSTKHSMCVFCESKQQSFDEACCAFVVKHNIERLANTLDISPTMLRNKLNPGQPHVLKPVELVAISKASGDYTLVNCLLLGLDVVTAPIKSAEQAESVLERLMKNSVNAGELSSWALKNRSKHNLSRTDKQSVIAMAQAGIGNLVLLISDIENRTAGASPILSMGMDFIANGVPLPGLS